MVVYQIAMIVSCYYTAFIIIGKFAIILNGELASNDTTMTEQVCTVSNSMDMVNLEQRCFLSCTESDSGTLNYSLSDYWPYVNVDETDCQTSRDLYQCTLGCVQYYNSESDSLSCRFDCQDTCETFIKTLKCDGLTPLCHPWISQQCMGTVECHRNIFLNRNPCRRGCELGDELQNLMSDQNNPSQVPPAPEGPPWLIPVQDSEIAGQFIIDLSGAMPQRGSCESTIENAAQPVVFLFKFEDVNSHNISFNWTATPFARLNLTGYACQELQVSFAVGNVVGLSEFSPTITIKIKRDNNEIIFTVNPTVAERDTGTAARATVRCPRAGADVRLRLAAVANCHRVVPRPLPPNP